MFLNDVFAQVLGHTLIDVEKQNDGDCGCGTQYTLHFDNGQIIDIYVHPDTGLVVEPD